MKDILVTSYVNPDLDGVACIIAYSELLNRTGSPATPGIFGEPHLEALFILEELGLIPPAKIEDIRYFEKIILVDNSLVNNLAEGFDIKKVVEVIDHRRLNDSDKFTNAKIQIELVGSAATLIAEKFKEQNVTPSAQSAVLLGAAIISNTLNFQSANKTERDAKAFDWLKSQADIPDNLAHEMFSAKSDLSGDRLQKALRGDAACYDLAGKKCCALQLEIIGSENLVDSRKSEILKEIKGIQEEMKLDSIYLSILDLEKNFNLFITPNPLSQQIISDVLGVEFNNEVAKRPGLILRKETMPLIKKYLESQ